MNNAMNWRNNHPKKKLRLENRMAQMILPHLPLGRKPPNFQFQISNFPKNPYIPNIIPTLAIISNINTIISIS